jgi:hypothetical protein
MAKKQDYNFNEKTHEYSVKQGKDIPVWVSPKYTASRKTAIEVIEKYDAINESDFWILMNETKTGKMAYTGLIISHNACLKINDVLEAELRFKPECMTLDKAGYGNSLVYTYICPEQGLFEVGEVSKDSCKNSYPYAMALKRCMDRVILKNSKIAYGGIYSDSEADEFTERIEALKEDPQPAEIPKDIGDEDAKKLKEKVSPVQAKTLTQLTEKVGTNMEDLLKYYNVSAVEDMTAAQYGDALKILKAKQDKKQ